MADFGPAVKRLLDLEGGYVFDPRDPGGETKFGISKRWNPTIEIKKLTRVDALIIYRMEWWERYNYGSLESQEIAADMLCLAANIGPLEAHKILQRALNTLGSGLKVDGVIGPMTIAAERAIADSQKLSWLVKLNAVHYYIRLRDSSTYLRGWISRVVPREDI